MKNYITLNTQKAYQLLNTGALILISTLDKNATPDIAPIAWQCPVEYEPETRLLFVCDKDHKTYKNIVETGKFVISVPHASQIGLVKDLGSCSGHEVDKIDKFKLSTFHTPENKCLVPQGIIGYMECLVHKIIDEDSVAIVIGKAIAAKVDSEAFSNRLLSENEEAKTIHHLGNKHFISTGNILI